MSASILHALAAVLIAAAATGGAPAPVRISPSDGLIAQASPHGETPRLPDGRPDLTGYWGAGDFGGPYKRFGARGLEFFEPDQATLQRGNAWNKPIYKPQFWEKVYNLDYGKVTDDPTFKCLPAGTPRQNMPHHITARPGEVVLFNNGGSFRIVPIDGRKRDPGDADYELFNGWPLGHWEGDTLVVESVGFTDQSWLLWTGYIHSNRMMVTERFTRKGDLLLYSFKVDDPQYLETPWVSDTYIRRLSTDPLTRLEESAPCREMDQQDIADPYYRG